MEILKGIFIILGSAAFLFQATEYAVDSPRSETALDLSINVGFSILFLVVGLWLARTGWRMFRDRNHPRD